MELAKGRGPGQSRQKGWRIKDPMASGAPENLALDFKGLFYLVILRIPDTHPCPHLAYLDRSSSHS